MLLADVEKSGRRSWVPALGRWRSVSFYVRMMRWFSLEDLPGWIAEDLALEPGMRVLDVGCGPGSLAQAVGSKSPAARMFGLDPDEAMLRHAQAQNNPGAGWAAGFAQALPFRDGSFDRVTMTLLLHHLLRPEKQAALAEAMRVLRPGGRLLVTDWTAPHGAAALGFLIVRTVDGFDRTADHAHGRVERLLLDAGVTDLRKLRTRELPLGTIAHFRGIKASR